MFLQSYEMIVFIIHEVNLRFKKKKKLFGCYLRMLTSE
jgi:hypothetical protein